MFNTLCVCVGGGGGCENTNLYNDMGMAGITRRR